MHEKKRNVEDRVQKEEDKAKKKCTQSKEKCAAGIPSLNIQCTVHTHKLFVFVFFLLFLPRFGLALRRFHCGIEVDCVDDEEGAYDCKQNGVVCKYHHLNVYMGSSAQAPIVAVCLSLGRQYIFFSIVCRCFVAVFFLPLPFFIIFPHYSRDLLKKR